MTYLFQYRVNNSIAALIVLSGLDGVGSVQAMSRKCRRLSVLGAFACLVITPAAFAEPEHAGSPQPGQGVSRTVESEWLNSRVLTAMERMPVGGGYAVTRAAAQSLGRAVRLDENGSLTVKAAMAQPSYCSGATYLILLNALKPEIDKVRDVGKRTALIRLLKVAGQADGIGIWGRWNANGPGMALIFAESGMGRSFWDFKSARPGDFLKLWWKDSIGRDEAGHSVVFVGYGVTTEGEDAVEIWSSNKPLGYGKKLIPLRKIRHALFSRCEHPERVTRLLQFSEKDNYLAEMLRQNTTQEEIDHQLSSRSTKINFAP